MRTILLIFFVILFAGSCKKDKKPSAQIQISGFMLVDASGSYIGQIGDASDDWELKNSLSAEEMKLFDFPTALSLDNTVETTVFRLNPYPNPFSNSQSYFTAAGDSVLLRFVVVDEKLNVFKRVSTKGKATINFTLDYSNRSEFPNKSSLRVYFSFSAKGKPNFKVGYGDIKVCDDVDYTKCF